MNLFSALQLYDARFLLCTSPEMNAFDCRCQGRGEPGYMPSCSSKLPSVGSWNTGCGGIATSKINLKESPQYYLCYEPQCGK